MKGLVIAKPGEQRTLLGCFKYLEDEITRVTTVPGKDGMTDQKVAEA